MPPGDAFTTPGCAFALHGSPGFPTTRKFRESKMNSATFGPAQESLMAADSDSRIAWHRAQVRKHRDALNRIETPKFTIGEIADLKAVEPGKEQVAELKQKIRQSQQVIAEHERQTRRPLATDLQSLSNVAWGNWTAYRSGQG
jgi:hypothetical protein